MPVHAAADVLVSLQGWEEPLEDVQGLPLLLAWGQRCQPLDASSGGASWDYLQPQDICIPGQTASPYVLEPEDSIEAFRSLPPTLRDR